MTDAPRFLPPGIRARLWRRQDRRRFEPGPRAHAELVILVGIRGAARYYIDGRVRVIEPRDALIAYPGQAHFLLGEASGTDLLVAVIAPELVAGGDLHPTLGEGAGRRGFARLARPGYDETLGTGEALARLPDGAVRDMGAGWWLHRLWVQVVEAERQSALRLHPAVAAAMEAIEADPGIGIGQVARAAGLTPTRLGQLFRQQIGQTPSAFRAARRMRKFRELSERDGAARLTTLALEAGFPDYAAFYRAFVREHGRGPRAARREKT